MNLLNAFKFELLVTTIHITSTIGRKFGDMTIIVCIANFVFNILSCLSFVSNSTYLKKSMLDWTEFSHANASYALRTAQIVFAILL